MSDASRPQRIEVLKSSVEEMRAKLSPTRAQIEQMMGIMQQLLQAKSADGGQQEEKAGGSGRGDANDNSSDAGRAPREEGAAGIRVGATTESAEGGKMSSHSSRTLDESRPADDTGRRKGSTIGEGGDKTISPPGRSPRQPLPGTELQYPLQGRQACPEFIACDQGVGQIYPR